MLLKYLLQYSNAFKIAIETVVCIAKERQAIKLTTVLKLNCLNKKLSCWRTRYTYSYTDRCME